MVTDSCGACWNSPPPPQWYVSLDPRFPVHSFIMASKVNLISVHLRILTNVGAKLPTILFANTRAHSDGLRGWGGGVQHTPIS